MGTVRCEHKGVSDHAKEIRSWRTDGDEQDPQCRRSGLYEVRGKWYCFQHAMIWQGHWVRVNKIRAIPVRR